jgi:SAM-dependent methyltransferase
MRHSTKRVLRPLRKLSLLLESKFDDEYVAGDVPLSQIVAHQKWQRYLYDLCNEEGTRILEVGSREVTGASRAREEFAPAEYVGFDYYGGRNVDVVGDAHRLSSYFSNEEKFDLVFSSATFEHFAMPWVVATEIAKVLKVGGLVFVETHFSYSSHERPWNFFQFSDLGLKVLFAERLGFECVEAGMSNPIVGRFSVLADRYLQNQPVTGLYCHSEYLGRKVRDVPDVNWSELDPREITGESSYPAPPQ